MNLLYALYEGEGMFVFMLYNALKSIGIIHLICGRPLNFVDRVDNIALNSCVIL